MTTWEFLPNLLSQPRLNSAEALMRLCHHPLVSHVSRDKHYQTLVHIWKKTGIHTFYSRLLLLILKLYLEALGIHTHTTKNTMRVVCPRLMNFNSRICLWNLSVCSRACNDDEMLLLLFPESMPLITKVKVERIPYQHKWFVCLLCEHCEWWGRLLHDIYWPKRQNHNAPPTQRWP